MTVVKRVALLPARVAARLREELVTRKGRRRLRRRLLSRFLLVAVAIAWTEPFVRAFWYEQLSYFVSGRVVVEGGQGVAMTRTAVVLVPEVADLASPGALARYSRIDPGEPLAVSHHAEDAAIWLWADVDGWFGSMHVAQGAPYRIEVRRSGCEPAVFGVRRFWLFDFWSRRLTLEVPPCVGAP